MRSVPGYVTLAHRLATQPKLVRTAHAKRRMRERRFTVQRLRVSLASAYEALVYQRGRAKVHTLDLTVILGAFGQIITVFDPASPRPSEVARRRADQQARLARRVRSGWVVFRRLHR